MNKAIELFDKILVNGQPIDLQELDINSGVYSAGSQKTLKVDFVLKKKDEIPAKIFSGLSYLKSVVVPESVTTVGARAFENTGAEITGLEQVETFGEGALVGAYMSYMSEEFISYIQEHNPDAFVSRYTELEAIAYNSYLPGALQYGAVKTPASHTDAITYTDVEVDEFNANVDGAVKIGDPSEDIYINDYDTNKIEYIYDENTWNESYANGIMKKYYETYPDKDWYNQTAHRAANFNDKAYDVDIYESGDTIYSFESYNNSNKEVKYGEGKVKVIEMRAGGATVEVIENTAIDPNADNFVGQQFNVATGLATDEPIQLYTLNNEPIDIWVTVSEVTAIQSGLSFKAGWVSDTVQKLTNRLDSSEVYYTDTFYSLDDNRHELFTDSACTTSANKFAKFNTITFPDCVHCWEGVVTAPGAKLPWVGVWFDEDLAVKMIYNYEGKNPVKPWGDNKIFGNGDGHKAWGFASVAEEFQDNTFLIEANKNNGKEAWNGTVGEVFGQFDMSKFSLVLEKTIFNTYDKEGANAVNAQVEGALQYDSIKTPAIDTPAELYTNEEVDALNAQLPGAVKAGDIKVKQQEEQEPQENQTVNGEVTSEDGGDTQIYNG